MLKGTLLDSKWRDREAPSLSSLQTKLCVTTLLLQEKDVLTEKAEPTLFAVAVGDLCTDV